VPYAARGVRWTEARRRATDRLVQPCVSIVLPSYNGADYLGELIHSCFQQAFSVSSWSWWWTAALTTPDLTMPRGDIRPGPFWRVLASWDSAMQRDEGTLGVRVSRLCRRGRGSAEGVSE
jgi:cellulose synthase/poly-beta-1,6-N-acetylglucosamine synthase-like glycosyltransferase